MQNQGASLVELLFRAAAERLVASIRRQPLDATRPGDGFCQFSGLVLIIFAGTVYLVVTETEKVGVTDPLLDILLDTPLRALLGKPRLPLAQFVSLHHQHILFAQPGPIASILPVGDIVVIVIETAVNPGVTPRFAGHRQDVFHAVAGGDGRFIFRTSTNP